MQATTQEMLEYLKRDLGYTLHTAEELNTDPESVVVCLVCTKNDAVAGIEDKTKDLFVTICEPCLHNLAQHTS